MSNPAIILHNTNRAFVAYLIAAGLGDENYVLPARRSKDRTAPNAVVDAHDCVEFPTNSGIYKIQVDIILETPAGDDGADVETESLEACGRLALALKPDPNNSVGGTPDLARLLNAAAAAASLAITFSGANDTGWTCGYNEDDTMWLDTARLELYASPVAPSPEDLPVDNGQ